MLVCVCVCVCECDVYILLCIYMLTDCTLKFSFYTLREYLKGFVRRRFFFNQKKHFFSLSLVCILVTMSLQF